MLQQTFHGDVSQLTMHTAASRRIGYEVSAFLVDGVLVDCGFPAIGREFARWLDANRPRGVMLTHHHEDHAGNVELLARGGVPIWMPAEAEPRLRALEPIGFYRRITWGTAPLLRSLVAPFEHPAMETIHTPGHSADHHVIWDTRTDTVFGGDLYLGMKVRIAHHDEDVRGTVRSLRMIITRRPSRFFDAHRGLLEDPIAALTRKADWMEETIAAIEARVRAGDSDREIRRSILEGEELTGHVSFGDYSRLNFVRAVRTTMSP